MKLTCKINCHKHHPSTEYSQIHTSCPDLFPRPSSWTSHCPVNVSDRSSSKPPHPHPPWVNSCATPQTLEVSSISLCTHTPCNQKKAPLLTPPLHSLHIRSGLLWLLLGGRGVLYKYNLKFIAALFILAKRWC